MALFGLFGPPDIDTLKANGDIKGLIKALNYQKDPSVCRNAISALSQIGKPAVKPLIDAIEIHANKYPVNLSMRLAISEALRQIGEPAIEPLNEAFKRNKDVHVRGFIIGVLERIGAPAIEALIKELDSHDPGNRRVAIIALARIGEPAVESLLIALKNTSVHSLFGSNEWYAQAWYAAQALGEICDTRAVEPLISALQDENKGMRKSAADALVKMYHSGKIDQQTKSKILAVKGDMAKKHHDIKSYSSDCNYSPHDDTGIGVTF